MKKISLLTSILISFFATNAQIVINEVQQSNISTLEDNFGEYPDWFELYNSGSTTLNLANYTVTDDLTKTDRWQFPSVDVAPGEFLTVYASGNDTIDYIDHWESPVLESDNWQYVVPNENTSTNWRELSFDDSGWLTGSGGFGYDDGDDVTILNDPTTSVFLRKTFTITDINEIHSAIFHMDYDDGFVAYLNGVEIARELMNESIPEYDDLATEDREAEVYEGGDYSEYEIDSEILQSTIIQGTNVLAIQVHNKSATSSDLSARPFLSIALSSDNTYWSNTPSFFNPETGTLSLHTNFSLKNGDEELFLINQGFIEESLELPYIPSGSTYGRTTDGGNTFKLLSEPSPSATNDNSPSYEGVIDDIPTFDLPAGFYASTQNVILSTSLTGVNIRYTTDGSKPDIGSTLYTGAIEISENTVLRAIIDKDGYISEYVETNSYIIGNDELSDLSVISLAVNPDDFFAEEDGIYVEGNDAEASLPYFGANFWKDIEREIHIEYFNEQNIQQLEQDCGVKIFGGWSRAQDMKSLRLIARNEYGDNSFSHQFFPDKNITDFKQLVLRNSGNDFNRSHLRDALNHEVIKEEGSHDRMAYRPVVVFLNGEYWGIHNLRERINPRYIEDNHGTDNEDITLIEMAGVEEGAHGAKQGDYSHWTDFVAFITDNSMNDANYQTVTENLDIENFADYMISQSYHNNWDAPHNNCRLWRPVDNSTKWRYIYYDTDFGLNLFNSSTTADDYDELDRLINDDRSDNTIIFKKLLENTDFKHFFINRYADLMNTTYTEAHYETTLDSIIDLLDNDIDRHHDLWGNDRNGWEGETNSISSFISNRRPHATQYVEDQFSLSGNYDITINISPEGAGKVKISTIVPTEYPWTGTYFNGCPVTITAIANKGYAFSHFTSANEFNGNNTNSSITYDFDTDEITVNFDINNDYADIIISEINYNSSDDSDSGDWIELHNNGGTSADIGGWIIKDGQDYNSFEIPVGTTLDPDEYLVISTDLEKFDSINPTVTNVIGEMDFKLSNGGEAIRIFDQFDLLKYSVTFSDNSPWSLLADGNGGTLEYQYLTTVDVNEASNWSFGCVNGSPGSAYSPCICESPELGDNKYLCEETITVLETGLDNPALSYSWYLNGDILVDESSSTLTNPEEGTYTAIVSTTNCIAEDNITILASPESIDLGEDFEFCSEDPILLETGIIYDNAEFTWYKDGSNLNTPLNSLSIADKGTYSVDLEIGNCAIITDEIIISGSSLTVNHSTTCNTGVHTLSVNGTGNYGWYATQTDDNLLSTGTSFDTPNISTTTSYFVEDLDYFGGSVGPENSDYSDTWGHDNFEDYKLRFSVLEDLNLHYITVFPKSETSSITINLTKDGSSDIIETVTVPVTDNEQRIYLGWELDADDYVMDAEGTDGELTMNNENTSYPYLFNDWMEITGTYPDWAGDNGWYFFFYNFEFSNNSVQRTCDRTTAIAYVCEEPTVVITTSESELKAGETTTLSVSIDQQYGAFTIDLGIGASPRYITEVGDHLVTFTSRGTYDATVEISDLNNNVYNQNISLNIIACYTQQNVTLTSNEENLCNDFATLTATNLSDHNYYWMIDNAQFDSGNELNSVDVDIEGNYNVEIKDILNEDLCSITTEIFELKKCPVATEDNVSIENVNIHPNPVENTLYYNLENIDSATIYDQLGRVVLTTTDDNKIDVSNLTFGIYIIEIMKSNTIYINKFEKK